MMRSIGKQSLIAVCALLLGGCAGHEDVSVSSGTSPEEGVSLVFWEACEEGSSQLAMAQSMADAFCRDNADAKLTITVEQVGSDCKDRIIGNLDDAPDVFTFADDQLMTLVAAGILNPVPNQEVIAQRNLAASVDAASVDGTLYAYPLTADNGYFLFYDGAVFDEPDVSTMDALLAKAESAGKKVTFDIGNGWYLYSFFGNTGLAVGLNDDGITNYCSWNATDSHPSGVEVCEGIERIASSAGFLNGGDDVLMAGAKDGTVSAGVSGVWAAQALEEAWGDTLRAAKLPTFTVAGEQIPLASYAGYRLVGVNSLSANSRWAEAFAEYMTNEANQMTRFEEAGQGPSNTNAAASDKLMGSVALQALLAQSEYSSLQRIGNAYWTPAAGLGEQLAAASGGDIQSLLDAAVKGITALPSD